MILKLRLLTLTAAISLIASCGQSNPHRHHEKQRTSSDIKISSLNLETKQIQMRFEYRSHVKKILKEISCDIEFNKQPPFNVKQSYTIELGAFSTETFNFHATTINHNNILMNTSIINYDITCELTYNKGREFVSESSVLHLVPSKQFLYR